LIWFGIIGVGATLTGIAANELARRGRATEVPARTVNWLTILYGLLAASLLLLAWTRSFWFAVLALWAISLCRSTQDPLENAWIVRNTQSAQRATVISVWGQANSLGQAAGGPVLGWIGTATRIPTALTVSSVVLLPAQLLLALARKGGSSSEEESSAE
ncbi:MAG: hypothetical protein OXC27_04335, partial [Caldilineaceae bacterium]|nr:hypothetical protein [Caldilineaceae bacterium]